MTGAALVLISGVALLGLGVWLLLPTGRGKDFLNARRSQPRPAQTLLPPQSSVGVPSAAPSAASAGESFQPLPQYGEYSHAPAAPQPAARPVAQRQPVPQPQAYQGNPPRAAAPAPAQPAGARPQAAPGVPGARPRPVPQPAQQRRQLPAPATPAPARAAAPARAIARPAGRPAAPTQQQQRQSAPAARKLPDAQASSAGFDFIRKHRRGWAEKHDFEFLREDPTSATKWKFPVLGLPQPPRNAQAAVLTNVVAGFHEQQQVLIGDIGGETVIAMRRLEPSLVTLAFSRTPLSPPPRGVRAVPDLNLRPFSTVASNPRAAQAMFDSRVADSLVALSQVAQTVACFNEWVVAVLIPRLDQSIWEAIFPQLRSIADAAMVLPPSALNAPLIMDDADQTRPMPGGKPARAQGQAPAASKQRGPGSTPASARGAQPQSQQPTPAAPRPGTAATPRPAAASSKPGSPLRAVRRGPVPAPKAAAARTAASAPPPANEPERPNLSRPAEPVAFPTRSREVSQGRSASFDEFHVGDIPRTPQPGQPGQSGARIPRVGQDSGHIDAPDHGGRPRVVRPNGQANPTIFE